MDILYDNAAFFESYSQMPRSLYGLSAAGEWSRLQTLFPALKGKRVLDLGCGYGWHCRYAADMGAREVLGIDASEKMIHQALRFENNPVISYRVCAIEDFEYPPNAYDLALSNLALHYVEDLDRIYRLAYQTLRPGGVFLFNIEHPTFTAGVLQDWIYDDQGKPLYWPVDRYYFPGERKTLFLGHEVKKQHHTLSQILGGLLCAGFRLQAVEEVIPPEDMMDLPGMADEMRRPMMLLVKVLKEV